MPLILLFLVLRWSLKVFFISNKKLGGLGVGVVMSKQIQEPFTGLEDTDYPSAWYLILIQKLEEKK